MSEYYIEVVFSSIDLDTDEMDRALPASVVGVSTLRDEIRVAFSLETEDVVKAMAGILQDLRRSMANLRPLRVEREFVNASEIAQRAGLSRQAVQHWTSGNRRESDQFPSPLFCVGKQKIWDWATVNAWLRRNLNLWDGVDYPDYMECSRIEAVMAQIGASQLGAKIDLASNQWLKVTNVPSVPVTTPPVTRLDSTSERTYALVAAANG